MNGVGIGMRVRRIQVAVRIWEEPIQREQRQVYHMSYAVAVGSTMLIMRAAPIATPAPTHMTPTTSLVFDV